MRLRRKPWIEDAIKEYTEFVCLENAASYRGQWQHVFDQTAPLYVELGTGKGRFVTQMADAHQESNFIGIEVQLGVLYYAAQKAAALNLKNIRLLLFDISGLQNIFQPAEVNRFYLNFCDPWPKARHAKRRLTYRIFLDQYAALLKSGGQVHFKTDNRDLFEFSLEEMANCHWTLSEVTYDLHHSECTDNIMTEYEEKFSANGQPIFRCVATKPNEVE